MPVLLLSLFIVLVLSSSLNAVDAAGGKRVLVFKMGGIVSNAQADAFQDALYIAETGGYSAIIMELSTPGGSVDAMLRIIQAIDGSPVPVIGYVYPAGATAWSAGTYILMATHLAAMAPNTVIGSCQPVSYSPLGNTPVNDSKIINALVSVMETHAAARNRNVTLAILFVTENLNVDYSEAQIYGVVEFGAVALPDLLQQVNGIAVNTSTGPTVIDTVDAEAIDYNFRLREILLNSVSDPAVASILFLVGLFALIYGLSAPGYGGEILGGVAILLSLIGMGFNVNVVSIVMIIIGGIMLIYEFASPGFGIMGIAGIILMIIGTLFIVPLGPENWAISGDWYMTFVLSVALAGICIAAIAIFAIIKIFQVRRKRPVIGGIVGNIVTATEDSPPGKVSYVMYNGEYWQAECETGLKAGNKYRIIGKDGYVLKVQEL